MKNEGDCEVQMYTVVDRRVGIGSSPLTDRNAKAKFIERRLAVSALTSVIATHFPTSDKSTRALTGGDTW